MNLLYEVYDRANIVKTGKYYTTINELTDQIPALRPSVLIEAATKMYSKCNCEKYTKILCEEDKGIILGTVISLMTGLPLAVAREYNYSIPDGTKVDYVCEYMSGELYINGVDKNDKVLIVDDTISTGGTLSALIMGVINIGATVEDIVVCVEKKNNKGVDRIKREFNINVQSCMIIDVQDGKVKVCRED